MKIGVTLRVDLFSREPNEASRKLMEGFGGIDGLFSYLNENVQVVEISTIGSKNDPEMVRNMVSLCRKYGLEVSFHGLLKEEPPEEFFLPYLPLLKERLGETYNITLHPLGTKEATVSVLKRLCSYVRQENFPVTFTLENQRLTSPESVNGTCESVAEIIEKVGDPLLAACFDFGHHLSNKRKQGEGADPFCEEFLQKIRHTHIHSMYQGSTHFPLNCGETELEEKLSVILETGYQGILLLELDFNRYEPEMDGKESLCRSVNILRNAIFQLRRKKEELFCYRENYPKLIFEAWNELEKQECAVALLSPSSYLVKLGETRLLIDPSLYDIPVTQKGREEFLELMASCQGVIYTHKHGDHYDSNLAAETGRGELTWFIPDFFSENDIRGGNLKEKNSVFVEANGEYVVGDVKIKFFESCHSSGETFVPEYGFALYYKGKHYVFPVDVRTYDRQEITPFPHTEVVFAHLWLGREKALEPDEGYLRQFTDFVKAYQGKRVCLGHLFDVRRRINDMWTDLHCDLLEDVIPLRVGMVLPL